MSARDYPASETFSGSMRLPARNHRASGRAPASEVTGGGAAPVFDLGQRTPLPVLKKPMRADSLVAMQAVVEQCHAMNAAAALIVRLIRDNDLPFIPRGIETARFSLGDLIHNVEEAMHAHHSVMDRG